MTQGVFVERSVSLEDMADVLEKNVGLVHLRVEKHPARFLTILTEAQKSERARNDARMAMLLGSPPSRQPSVTLEKLRKQVHPEDDSRPGFVSCYLRPRTKKQLREEIARDPARVFLEETSVFGNEYQGFLNDAPEGHYAVVGPDPQRKRSWFANIVWSEKKQDWIVR